MQQDLRMVTNTDLAHKQLKEQMNNFKQEQEENSYKMTNMSMKFNHMSEQNQTYEDSI